MTVLSAGPTSVDVARPGPAPAAEPARVPTPPRSWTADVLPSSLALLALGLLAFIAQVGPLSWIEHSRAQKVAYADLRRDLANGVVPTGQRDADGQLVAAGTALGFLTAPGLGLEREVFFEGTTATVLEDGPGHRRTSVLPGQAGVAVLYGRAAAYGGPFGDLPDVRKGTVITVTTQQGESRYEVTGTRREGDPVSAPVAGTGRLTLVTADGPAYMPDGAVFVDATLLTPPQPAAAPVLPASALSASEGPMEGDPTAWALLLLAAQGVALAALGMTWASRRFGKGQSWIVGVPVVGLLLVLTSQQAVRLLPNLL